MSSKRHRTGVALCLLSAAGFGGMAIFAKYAYRAGFGVVDLLALRFVIAAGVFWVVVAARRSRLPDRGTVASALALGAIGYAAQAGLFFGAVDRIEASLASLLLYLYPALVFVLTLVLGHEQASRRRLAALACASAGAVLVLAGAGGGSGASSDGLGIAMALGAALAYTGYILVAGRRTGHADPLVVAALICTGAAVTFAVAVALTGGPQLDVDPGGWLALVAVALVSTVLPVATFLAGLRIVGASTASILSTLEPVVTVALAIALFGESLSPVQGLGGLAVLSAVVLLRPRRADSVGERDPAADAPRPAPARALAGDAA